MRSSSRSQPCVLERRVSGHPPRGGGQGTASDRLGHPRSHHVSNEIPENFGGCIPQKPGAAAGLAAAGVNPRLVLVIFRPSSQGIARSPRGITKAVARRIEAGPTVPFPPPQGLAATANLDATTLSPP